jgi:surface antigen
MRGFAQRQLVRFSALGAFACLLTACASVAPDQIGQPGYVDAEIAPQIETPNKPLQCVPYARARSGVNLHGDAVAWWDLAAGKYVRSSEPSMGSVLVLTGYAGPGRGHVAVVVSMDSARQIRIDHANWLDDGRIYRNDPVIDVSPDNDWSAVRVWDTRDNVLGARTYTVRGFIGPGREEDQHVASSE